MIDFENGKLFKLRDDKGEVSKDVLALLIDGEEVIESFKTVRDSVIFTNKRIIAINAQGIGAKKDFTSLPYSKIQAFSVETAGLVAFDGAIIDSELELLFGTLGTVKFEFSCGTDIKKICRAVSTYVL